MELEKKNVVVVGSGVSGIGAVGLLLNVNANVTLYDGNESIDLDALMAKIGNDDVKIILGTMPEEVIKKTDLLVISPGVPIDSEIVLSFKKENVPVWGEIELAYNYEKGTVFAITGTNGKTTTTTLVGEIMKKYNSRTFVVGNIGTSYTGEVLKTTDDSFTVAEISSFQLETIHDFMPKGTAILNITPDHLNRHYTMENYALVKESITKNQWKNSEDDYCVLNYDDEVLREFGKTIKKPVYFSRKNIVQRGAYLKENVIRYNNGSDDFEVVRTENMHLFGNHNYENVMAGIALTIEYGVPLDIIRETVENFMGVEHRIEYVRDKDGVTYYNDSKGTNPDSSIKALEAITRPIILIAGGYDKHSEFDEFIEAFSGKVKLLVLLGQTADIIDRTARRHGFDRIIHVESLLDAVTTCADNAVSGDVVLLSPACASWGMFKNYEERGVLFKKYVNEL